MQSDTSSVDVVDDIDDDNNDNDDVGSSSEEKDSLGIMMMYSVRLLLVHYKYGYWRGAKISNSSFIKYQDDRRQLSDNIIIQPRVGLLTSWTGEQKANE